jgi:hypothetical protein
LPDSSVQLTQLLFVSVFVKRIVADGTGDPSAVFTEPDVPDVEEAVADAEAGLAGKPCVEAWVEICVENCLWEADTGPPAKAASEMARSHATRHPHFRLTLWLNAMPR